MNTLVEQTRERLARYDKSYLLRSQAERDQADSEQAYYKAILTALPAQAEVTGGRFVVRANLPIGKGVVCVETPIELYEAVRYALMSCSSVIVENIKVERWACLTCSEAAGVTLDSTKHITHAIGEVCPRKISS